MGSSHGPVLLVTPWDESNQQLVANVHPPDWINPKPATRYNLVVIGAGTAGLIAAAGAAGLGAKVALIEKHLLGGDCLNVGCVPSKALLRAARASADVRDAGEFGISLPSDPPLDFKKVMERMRKLRAEISRNDSAVRYRQMGVDVFIGAGKFTSPETVEVEGQTLRFRNAVITTGTRAAVLPIPGLAEARALTNETVFSLMELPRRLAVIGAGPIGCELAQAFRRFGSEVTLLEAEPRILPREDADAAAIVSRVFDSEGLRMLSGVSVGRVEQTGGSRRIHFTREGQAETLDVDEILVSVGRIPNVEGLDLAAAGVEHSKQGVTVNDFLQTTHPDIYAAGDICSAHKFTHVADAMARLVIQNALFGGRKKVSSLIIPWCTYTDPEIAHVGLHEHDARKRGLAVKTFVQRFDEVDRAILDGETGGLVKVRVREGTDRILGATIVTRHAGEMIGEITVAIAGKMGLAKLANVIHPYPTQAEAIKKVADACNRTRLTPLVRKLLDQWLSWIR
ncbi:MAG: mercuric reductase [Verrucomicrobia bacterium]|nr:mercuric reductase [Verrucomicrobiota bacterium]